MTIILSPELQAFINEQVEKGKYQSADEAIVDAVRRMKEQSEKLAWLRNEVQEGLDEFEEGKAEPWDVGELKSELEKKYGQRE